MTGVACSPPTKRERNHLARCTSQRWAAKPDALASSELQYQHLAHNWAVGISKALLRAVFLNNGRRQRRVYLCLESNSTVPVFHLPVLSKRCMCRSLRTHGALNTEMLTQNRTRISHMQTHNGELNTNSKLLGLSPSCSSTNLVQRYP